MKYMNGRALVAAVILLLAGACGDDGGGAFASDESTTGPGDETTETSSSGTTGPSDTGSTDRPPPGDTSAPRVGPCDLIGASRRCYTGPSETRNVGVCRDGIQICVEGEWGPCEGEVLPGEEFCDGRDNSCNGIVDDGVRNACGECGAEREEICGNGLDDNCNGIIDDGCPPCDPLLRNQPCYSGPPQTLGVGDCRGGTMDCIDGTWSACEGEVLPTAEVCDGRDNSCSGRIDDGVLNACGECIGTESEEICNGEDTNCNGIVDDGLRVEPCGWCPEDISAEEVCGTGLDNNCSGVIDEGCSCEGLAEQRCYPGDPDVIGVGICDWGMQRCDSLGENWLACEDYTLPLALEVCDGQDSNCNGIIDDGAGCNCVAEVCDGQDNNCSGFIDDGLRCTNMDSSLTLAGGRCFEDLVNEVQMQRDMEADPTSWIDLCPSGNCCDGLDNDCNGIIDDGLLNSCGTCDQSCYLKSYEDGDDFAAGELEGVDVTPEGNLVLGESQLLFPDLWVASEERRDDFFANIPGAPESYWQRRPMGGQGTVTRINTDTGEVTGVFRSMGWMPSRTAIDNDWNVWVANRAYLEDLCTCNLADSSCADRTECSLGHSRQGSLTRIYRDCPCEGLECLDRWDDPECTTGPIELGLPDANLRGLAVDAQNNVWVGSWTPDVTYTDPVTGEERSHGPTLYRVNADTLEVTEYPSPVRVYGIAVDSEGLLWLASVRAEDGIGCFDPVAETFCPNLDQGRLRNASGFLNRIARHGTTNAIQTYGIVIDDDDNIWTGNWQQDSFVRIDRESLDARMQTGDGSVKAEIFSPPAGQDLGSSRGVAIDRDGAVYVAWSSGNRVTKFNYDANHAQGGTYAWTTQTCGTPVGVGVARDGDIWSMCFGGHAAERFDAATGTRIGSEVPVGRHPYSYSDFTGFQLTNVVSQVGTWREVFDCGREDCAFDFIMWDADVPPGSEIRVRASTADSASGPWVPSNTTEYFASSPANIAGLLDRGRYLRVELQLRRLTRQAQSPTLRGVDVGWQFR